MGLMDNLIGDGGVLLGRRGMGMPPRVTTPSALPPTEGSTITLPDDPNNPSPQLSPQDQLYQKILEHPPQKGVSYETGKPISKARSIIGEILANAGPLIGRGNLGALGNKLLYPGADKYQSDLARTAALSGLADKAEQRADLRFNRKAVNDARLSAEASREQGNVDRIEAKGGYKVPMPSLQQSLYPGQNQPQGPPDVSNLPTTQLNLRPSLPNVEDQIDPRTQKPVGEVGDVQQLPIPGTQGKQTQPYVIPSQATLAEAEVKKRQADQEAMKSETISDDEAHQLNELGYDGDFRGKRVTPAERARLMGDITTRMNSRDSIAAKNPPADKENENQWIATVNDPTSSPADVATAKAKLAALRAEKIATRPPPSEASATNALDRVVARFSTPHRKTLADADSQLEKIAEAKTMINGSASAQALGIPKVLTALVSGAGSGVRITQAELNSIAKARGIEGDLEGFISRVSGKGVLTPVQQQQLSQVLDDAKAKIAAKRLIADEALDQINGAESRDEVIKADKEARKKAATMVMGPQSAPIQRPPLSSFEVKK